MQKVISRNYFKIVIRYKKMSQLKTKHREVSLQRVMKLALA